MIYVRPVQPIDLEQLEHLASSACPILHSLPADHDMLTERLSHSVHSFNEEASVPGDELYCLVMEDTSTGQLLGTASIIASAGQSEPFYTYRNEIIVHASRELKINNRVRALTLCHELTGNTQLSSFCVSPEIANTNYPALLSRTRLLLIATHPERYSEDLFAVLPGVSDEAGYSPFWENVGHKFFGLEFRQAEFLSGGRNKTFIAELMPHHPLYVPLLSDDAQAAMGQLHPGSTLPFSILADEGFESKRFIDIFDAGPVMTAKRGLCRSIHHSQTCTVALGTAQGEEWFLVCNTAITQFRAMLVKLPAKPGDSVVLDPHIAALLEIDVGDEIYCTRLHYSD